MAGEAKKLWVAAQGAEVFLDERMVLGRDLIRAGQVELALSETFELTPEPVLELFELGEDIFLELLETEWVQVDLLSLELFHTLDDLTEVGHVQVLTRELLAEPLGVRNALAKLAAHLPKLFGRERARLIGPGTTVTSSTDGRLPPKATLLTTLSLSLLPLLTLLSLLSLLTLLALLPFLPFLPFLRTRA